MPALAIAASALQVIHRAGSIAFILFGAILLLRTMQSTGALATIKQSFLSISTDMRIQAVLIGFAFISLLESVSGFGTPAIIAAPLLLLLGFSPLAAASLALLGDTVSVTFGAAGTPLLVGLENVPNYSEQLAWIVGAQVTLFDIVIGSLLPLGMICVLVFGFSHQTTHSKLHAIRQSAPWAILIGATYSLNAFVAARFVGPELTAIIAGGVTLAIGTLTARHHIATPHQIWHTDTAHVHTSEQTPPTGRSIWRAWLPYGMVVLLLLFTRTIPSIKTIAGSLLDISWHHILGFQTISSSWEVLYSPGTILCSCAVIAAIVSKKPLISLKHASWSAIKSTVVALTALIPTLLLVQVFTNSNINTAGFAAMPIVISSALAQVFGGLWTPIAPLLGAIGAFIAGSATVSTLTLGSVQASIAAASGLPIITILALHMVGAAAGNIIAIHNVVAAATVVGLSHKEGRVIRQLLAPTVLYLTVASVVGLLAVAGLLPQLPLSTTLPV